MYLAHHNGKPNRYKIRFRKYIASNLCFLEIKNKYKGNRTIKNRLQFDEIETNLSDKSKKFIEQYTPFQNITLYPKIYTNFSRITLVNKALAERVTIDLDLCFKYNGYMQALENVAIIEIKRDTATCVSSLTNTLNYYHVFSQGFSKYCIGRALIEKNLKSNSFKERIITINKINDGKYYYHNFNQH
jgi:hypothetical protein